VLSGRLRAGLTLAEAISIVVQIGGALQFAHDNGIIHRDLKPANIIFRDAHTPVLTDFGIARQQDPAATRLTQSGVMLGTPTYMSPEQATGGAIDGRSDLYSLGVLFFEMLAGRAPFHGDTSIQVALAHLHAPPPALPASVAFLQPTMDRLLAKDPAQRFPDLRSFIRQLKALLTSSDVLLQRLQVDASHSATEQLRALGFSESQIHTGSTPIPNLDMSRPALRSGNRAGMRIAPARLLLALAASGLLALALAFGVGPGSGRGDTLDPATRNIVDRALRNVDQLIAQGKLVAPADDNAYEELQDVLQVAPNYPHAQQRLADIVDRLRGLSEQALAAQQFDTARTHLIEVLAIVPDDPQSLDLQQRLERAHGGAERDSRIGALLAAAAAARHAGRLHGAGPDNALALLRQALDIDPQHAGVREALDGLAVQILQPVRDALDAGRLDEGVRHLQALAPLLGGESGWHWRTPVQHTRD
jgi:serine/threonine-protein kinase PpkA